MIGEFIPQAGLVGLWHLNGNSNDSSGNANNGIDTDITYSLANGKFGQGAGFNGTTSKIVLPNAAVLKPTGNFSILLWGKLTSSTGMHVAFQSYSQNTNVAGIQIGVNVTNESIHKLVLLSGKNTGGSAGIDYQRIIGNTSVDDAQKHFIAGVWDGSNLRLYFDGVPDATPVAWANAPAYAPTTYVRIGDESYNGGEGKFWNNALDEVAIFSRALSASEIKKWYAWSKGKYL